MPKYFSTIIIAFPLVFSGCGWFSGEAPVKENPGGETVSKIPFPVKEPSKYSADIVIKTNADGKVLTSTYFVARDGKNRIERFSVGNDGEFSILMTEKFETFRIFPAKKEYEVLKKTGLASMPGSLARSMTNRWLNAEKRVSFVELGVENGLKKYNAQIEGSKDTEIVIYVDPKLEYPVKQEMFSTKNGKRELVFSMELQNISLQPDSSLFVIPQGYTLKPETQLDEELKK